ncbi:MAG: calcium/sodium antiporter [Candidatus Omnitrophota bacterium]
MLIQALIFLLALIILYAGGELFVKGSSSTARIFGIKPLIIGLVIAAFATSSPEFFVSLLAVLRKNSDLAIGNVIGSCIANIGLALGIAALFKPITIKSSIIRRELPILVVVTLVFFAMCLDYRISKLEAFLLIISFFLFIFYCIKTAKEDAQSSEYPEAARPYPRARPFIFLAAGLAGLLIGAHFLVESSVSIARHFGISDMLIGLSIVAIGTSLPEIVTSIMASVRGESDISIGTVVGSNIFNILAIVGFVCFISPVSIKPGVIMISLPLLLLYTLALGPILKTGLKISRAEGAFLIVTYFLYIYLIFIKR